MELIKNVKFCWCQFCTKRGRHSAKALLLFHLVTCVPHILSLKAPRYYCDSIDTCYFAGQLITCLLLRETIAGQSAAEDKLQVMTLLSRNDRPQIVNESVPIIRTVNVHYSGTGCSVINSHRWV
jgi:hypothetical protein